MKKSMWKRVLAIICAISMVLPAAGVNAWAEELPEQENVAWAEEVETDSFVEEVAADAQTEDIEEIAENEEELEMENPEEDFAVSAEEPDAIEEEEAQTSSAPKENEFSIEAEENTSVLEAAAEGEPAYTLYMGGEEQVFTLSPKESGIYEFLYDDTSKEGEWTIDYTLSSEGEFLASGGVYDGWYSGKYASFMLEAGKTYTLSIEAYVGTLYLNKLEGDPFTIEDGVLKAVDLGNVDYLILPEGITEISSSGYSDIMSKNHINGSIVFPSTITKINGWYLSENMGTWSSLKNYYVAEGNENYKSIDGILYSGDGETLLRVPGSRGGSIAVPGNPKVIGEDAFLYSIASEVILPDSVEEIGSSAFSLARSMKSITLGNKVKKIGSYAFSNSGLTSIELPDSVVSIDYYAFKCDHSGWSDGTPLKSIKLSKSLESIGNNAFAGAALTEIELPDSLTYLGSEAFKDNLLEEIVIPESLEDAGSGVFDGCKKLKKITVNTNGDITSMFEGADNLEEIVFGENVTKYALVDEKLVMELGYKDSYSSYDSSGYHEITVVGNYLFFILGEYETEVFSTDGCVAIDPSIYSHLKGVKKLSIGRTTLEFKVYDEGINLPELEQITVAEGNPNYYAEDGVLYEVSSNGWWENYGLVCYPSCKAGSSFTVPDQIDYIADHAFTNYGSNPRKLTSVTIPADTKLNDYVFSTWDDEIIEPVLTINGYPDSDAYDYYLENYKSENLAWNSLGPLTVIVYFNPNKGSVSTTQKTVTIDDTYGTLPTPKRSNYYFLGWYNAAGNKVTASTTVSEETDHTLTAKWKKAEIGDTIVTVDDCTWNGKEQKPAVTVKLSGKTLKEGTHYTLTYKNNKEPGTGKVIVKGAGVFKNSSKTKTATFTISKKAQTIKASGKTYEATKIGTSLTISATVKEKAKLTFTSSDSGVVKIIDKNTGKVKLVGAGVATITIKAAATTHYKSASKKITIKVKGIQSITLKASFVKKNTAGQYELSSPVFAKSLGVKVNGGATYTCLVESTGKGNLAWFTSGDKLTTEGAGTFSITINVDATKDSVYPALSECILFKQKGVALTSDAATNYTYRQIDSGKAAIVKYIGSAKKVTIPTKVTIGSKAKTITAIDKEAFASQKITSVSMSDSTSVKKIGTGVFKNCASLKTLRLATGITSIGKQAFYGCKALESVAFPDGIKTIGSEAFSGTSLKGILTLPNSLQKLETKSFYGCSGVTKLMMYSYVSSVGNSAFEGCSGIKDVYYSASQSRWNAIAFGSGNTTVTGATLHFNAAAPPTAYEVTDITDEMIFNSYPEALNNPGYEEVTTSLEDELLNVMISHTTTEETIAALKSEFTNGYTYAIKALIEDAVAEDGGRTWTEKEVDRALALDLLREASEVDEIKSELADTLEEVYKGLKKLKPYAKQLVTNEDNRSEVAAYLYDMLKEYLKNSSKKEFEDMLKTIGKYWERSEDYPEVTFSISDAFEAVDVGIDVADFTMDIITLMIVGEKAVDRALEYAPEESALYDGFLQLRVEMDLPFETFVLRYLTKEFLSELSKTLAGTIVSETSKEALFTVSKGTLLAASVFYKFLGIAMQCPTIDSYNNAWISTRNTIYLHQIVRDLQTKLVNAKNGDNTKLKADYIYFVNMYFSSLNSAGKYVASTMKDPEYLNQKMKRYKTAFTYSAFMRSCKENAVELGMI